MLTNAAGQQLSGILQDWTGGISSRRSFRMLLCDQKDTRCKALERWRAAKSRDRLRGGDNQRSDAYRHLGNIWTLRYSPLEVLGPGLEAIELVLKVAAFGP